MVCDFCHEREARIFLEQISNNGQKRKINICMECAVSRGISSDPKSIEASIGDLFRELSAASKRLEARNNKLCPVCGTSASRVRTTGITGCPECYSIFKDEISALMAKRGIEGTYAGTLPQRLSSFHSVLNDRIILRNKLNDAVAKEDYEKAAMYRDYLRALESRPVADAGEEESLDSGGDE